MNVHVPQTRNQIFATTIYAAHIGWYLQPSSWTHGGDTRTAHDDRLIRHVDASNYVYDGNARYGDLISIALADQRGRDNAEK